MNEGMCERKPGRCAGVWLLACACAAVPLWGIACAKPPAEDRKGRRGDGGPVPVSVAKVVRRSVTKELSAVGTVVPSASVAVRAEVTGILTDVCFQAGQDANQGDVLFRIDPRPYEAALKQAQAVVQRAQAALKQAQAVLERDRYQAANARLDLEREAELLRQNLTPQADYDRKKTDSEALAAVVRADEAGVQADEAGVRADEAAVDLARLQVERCTIRSPVHGRTGDLLLDRGNLAKANDQALVVIHQVRPVKVSFAVPQGDLPLVRKHMAEGPLEVSATLPREPNTPEAGVLVFVANEVDRTTGTIRLEARFANERLRLWPGLFVNAGLVLTADPNALVVPARAIQTGREGKYVFVVKADKTVEYRPVVVRSADTEIAVIEKGLEAGETVVTDGHLRLVDGTTVEIKPDVTAGPSARTAPATGPGDVSEPGAPPPAKGGRAGARRGGRP